MAYPFRSYWSRCLTIPARGNRSRIDCWSLAAPHPQPLPDHPDRVGAVPALGDLPEMRESAALAFGAGDVGDFDHGAGMGMWRAWRTGRIRRGIGTYGATALCEARPVGGYRFAQPTLRVLPEVPAFAGRAAWGGAGLSAGVTLGRGAVWGSSSGPVGGDVWCGGG